MSEEDIVRIGAVPGEPTKANTPQYAPLNFMENLPTVLYTEPDYPVIIGVPDWVNNVQAVSRTWGAINFMRAYIQLHGNNPDFPKDAFFSANNATSFDEFIGNIDQQAQNLSGMTGNIITLTHLMLSDYLNSLGIPSIGSVNYGWFYNPNNASDTVTYKMQNLNNNINSGDWSALGSLGLTPDTLIPQMKNAFAYFLKITPLSQRNAVQKFFNSWHTFLAITAKIDNSSTFASYRKIYDSFGFDPNDFSSRLITFYNETLEKSGDGDPAKGWFIPSHYIDEWFEELRDEYIATSGVRDTSLSSVSLPAVNESGGTNFKSAASLLTIDRILKLLIAIIDVLQNISALQASYLGYLTDWQKSYTDHMNDIPVFSEGDGSLLTGGIVADMKGRETNDKGELIDDQAAGTYYDVDDDDEYNKQHFDPKTINNKIRNARGEINTAMQAVQERIRGKRNLIQDTAKQMQTTINQSQDAANQQVQMATALLQQLSTIISQIFR